MTWAFLNVGSRPNLTDQDGFSLLMAAVRYEAISNVKTLLAAGADVNVKAQNGDTALSMAKRFRYENIVLLLTRSAARF